MFRRLQLETFQDWLAVFALAASLGIFLYFLYRMIRMKKEKIDYLSHLPLEEDIRVKKQNEKEGN